MDKITTSRIKSMSPQFLVSDMERSIEFYVSKLEFQVDFRYEDFYAGMRKDGWSIHLKAGKPAIEERKSKKMNQDLDLVCSVDGIEDLYANLSNKDVTITQPLRTMPYGREFYIEDPDGYIISFLEEK